MIPRYLPALDLRTAVQLWSSSDRAAVDSGRHSLAPDGTAWHAYGSARARLGLVAWLRSLDARPGSGVLVSAQICPAVRWAIVAAGLTPRYLDLDEAYPTPAPQSFAAALTDDVAAAIVAPFYGYVQDEWQALTGALGSTRVCVDLAQGLLLESRLGALIGCAEAVLYSFAVGKGLDLGGGVLFTRSPLRPARGASPARVLDAGAAWSGLAVRALAASGLYRLALPLLERAIDEDETDAPPGDLQMADVSANGAIWFERRAAFAADVDRARLRAQRIGAIPAVAAVCRETAVYFSGDAIHLRLVIRLNEPQRRAAFITSMRRLGVDCAPAGEPLPAGPAARFPNAERFTRDAVRLPFLGRLTDRQQQRVEHALEVSLG